MSAILFAALLGAGGMLYAQGRGAGTGGSAQTMRNMMPSVQRDSSGMGMMMGGPDAALARARELGLTDAQRQRLRELAKATRDVLTADQRAKLADLEMADMMRMMKMMSAMKPGEGSGGMRGMMGTAAERCPMWRGTASDTTHEHPQ